MGSENSGSDSVACISTPRIGFFVEGKKASATKTYQIQWPDMDFHFFGVATIVARNGT